MKTNDDPKVNKLFSKNKLYVFCLLRRRSQPKINILYLNEFPKLQKKTFSFQIQHWNQFSIQNLINLFIYKM